VYVFKQLPKHFSVAVKTPNTHDVQSIFSQGTCLVETADIDFPCYIDSAGSNAINSLSPKTSNGEASSNSQRCWKGRRYDNCDEIKGANDNCCEGNLTIEGQKVLMEQTFGLACNLTNCTALKQKPRPAIPAKTPMKRMESR